jgi:hypothetical protein
MPLLIPRNSGCENSQDPRAGLDRENGLGRQKNLERQNIPGLRIRVDRRSGPGRWSNPGRSSHPDRGILFRQERATPESGVRTRSGDPPQEPQPDASWRSLPGLLKACANPGCRSGWLHLWRSRARPIFEDGWTCSSACTEARLRCAVAREMDIGGSTHASHRHRVPLGLLMLEQGWITREQLRRALDAQKAAGSGRLGQWLVTQKSSSEEMVTRALGLQWSCPVLRLEHHECSTLPAAMPRLFVDAFGALPLCVAGGKAMYLGFEESLDPILALAIERMNGLRVESGIVWESRFRPAHRRLMDARFASVELVEAISLPAAAHALARAVERARPVASRLVRVHDCLWLRMWLRAPIGSWMDTDSVQDVVCSIGGIH